MGKVTIGEIDILDVAIRTTLDHGHSAGEGVDAVEIDVADAFTAVVLSDLQADRIHVVAINGDVGEGKILDQSIFHALVGHTQFIGVAGQAHSDAGAGLGDVQVGESHIPHHAVVNIAHTDGAGVAGQVTIGDGNTLADGILVKGSAIGPDDDAVVAAGDVAVGDVYIGTAVDVDAVVVGNVHCGADLQPVEADVEAIADPVTPAAPLIGHGNFFHNHILAADEEYHTGRCEACLAGVQVVGVCTNMGVGIGQGNKVGRQRHGSLPVRHMGTVIDLLLGHRGHIVCTLAIDSAATGDADIFTTLCVNEATLIETDGIFCAPEIGLNFGEITVVCRAKQNGIALNMQVNTVLHIDPATEELAAFQNDLAAAVGRAIINSSLNRSGIQSCAVALGTVVFNIAV